MPRWWTPAGRSSRGVTQTLCVAEYRNLHGEAHGMAVRPPLSVEETASSRDFFQMARKLPACNAALIQLT